MKKIFLIVTLLFWAGLLFGQQNTTLLKMAQAEITRLNIVLADTKVDRDKLTIAIATLSDNARKLNDGIKKAENLLQKGYDSGKLNYEELRLMGFEIVVDTTNVYQRPKPDKDKKH